MVGTPSLWTRQASSDLKVPGCESPLSAPLIPSSLRLEIQGTEGRLGHLLAGSTCCLSLLTFLSWPFSICVHAADLGLFLYLSDFKFSFCQAEIKPSTCCEGKDLSYTIHPIYRQLAEHLIQGMPLPEPLQRPSQETSQG